MAKSRRKLSRISETREYRPVLIIATEGKKTEPIYFRMRIFKSQEISVRLEILPTRTSSSPISVQKRMEKHIRDYRRRDKDEFWLVVDKDSWNEEDLDVLFTWTSNGQNRYVAVSNPRFEYWLLLHFEDAQSVNSPDDCTNKLIYHCPNYSKNNIPENRFPITNVKEAIRRAKEKDDPACEKWPEHNGTTVYRLVERIIA